MIIAFITPRPITIPSNPACPSSDIMPAFFLAPIPVSSELKDFHGFLLLLLSGLCVYLPKSMVSSNGSTTVTESTQSYPAFLSPGLRLGNKVTRSSLKSSAGSEISMQSVIGARAHFISLSFPNLRGMSSDSRYVFLHTPLHGMASDGENKVLYRI